MAFNPLKADEELGAVGHQQIDALTFSPEKADKALFNDDSVARQTINSNPEHGILREVIILLWRVKMQLLL